MASYVIRRIIQAIPILFGISILIFGIVQLAPGSPVDRFRVPRVPPEQIEALIRLYGLDKPVLEQYVELDHGLRPGLAYRRLGLLASSTVARSSPTSWSGSRRPSC